MDDALLPAERTMVAMGEQQRVRESRTFLEVATGEQFIAHVISGAGPARVAGAIAQYAR
jgi:hypothetical protein